MRSTGDPFDPNIGKVYGHCRLERKIGEGGMAAVYLATHTTLNKLVAVKLLRSHLGQDPKASERFLREARSAAKVEHPAVVQVYDIGQVDKTFYIVMQYVEGTTLEEMASLRTVFPLPEAIRIIITVCEGVREAHLRGIVHRDIKPDNILLGKDGSVKLADFGLARAIKGDPALSHAGCVFGTPHFMSPEQALGETVDHRSDIFSVGATFYRLVTGRYPFHSTSLMGVVFKLTHEQPPPLREINPSIPKEVSDLIEQMMAKDPDQRIGPMTEVLKCLRRLQPLVASLPKRSRNTKKFPTAPRRQKQRHRYGKAYGKQIFMAIMALSAFLASGILVANHYGLLSQIKAAIAKTLSLEPEKRENIEKKKSTRPASSGSKDSAGTPASNAPGGDQEGTPGQKTGTDESSASQGQQNPQGLDHGPRNHSDQFLSAVGLLEKRVEEFLMDAQKYPSRTAQYLVPGTEEPEIQRIQRTFFSLTRARSSDSPPLGIKEIRMREDRLDATVFIQGFAHPLHLNWVIKNGEWYIQPLVKSRNGGI